MKQRINNGVWPTMITPFTLNNKIDFNALEELIEWYLKNKVDGLFAVCQSSEMFNLSLDERIELAKFTVKKVKGRVPVVATGNVSTENEAQLNEITAMADTGVDAVILITNRMAKQNESDDIWKKNVDYLINNVSDVPLGFYECPYPYKRLVSPDLLKWCAQTGRFFFLKDTCCNADQIRQKYYAVKGTSLKIFNANSATLLDTLKTGIAGYSGVMANFHPELYVRLYYNWSKHPKRAEELQNFLGFASVMELQLYPVNAKYHMELEGLKFSTYTRTKDASKFNNNDRLTVEQFHAFTKTYSQKYNAS